MSSSSPGYGGGKIKAKETRHRWVPLSVIARFALSVIARLTLSVIAALTLSVIARLTLSVIARLTLSVIARLTLPVIAALTLSVIARLTLPVIAALTLSVIARLTLSVIARHGVPKQSRAVLTGEWIASRGYRRALDDGRKSIHRHDTLCHRINLFNGNRIKSDKPKNEFKSEDRSYHGLSTLKLRLL